MILFNTQLGLENTSGKSIVIMHGFLGTSDNWITIARQLAETYQVTLLDLRNHGRSPHSEEFTYEAMAADVKETLDNLGIQKPILIGHSMGGKTVMAYSIAYPEAFEKLIIVDIAPKFYPTHHQTIFDGLLSIDMNSLTSRAEADKQLSAYVSEPGVRQFLLKNLDRIPNGFKWKANIKLLNQKIEEVGKETFKENVTQKSVLFIAGDSSNYIVREDRERIKSMYPNASVLSIKNSGHWVHAEQPEAFLSVLHHFLEQ